MVHVVGAQRHGVYTFILELVMHLVYRFHCQWCGVVGLPWFVSWIKQRRVAQEVDNVALVSISFVDCLLVSQVQLKHLIIIHGSVYLYRVLMCWFSLEILDDLILIILKWYPIVSIAIRITLMILFDIILLGIFVRHSSSTETSTLFSFLRIILLTLISFVLFQRY